MKIKQKFIMYFILLPLLAGWHIKAQTNIAPSAEEVSTTCTLESNSDPNLAALTDGSKVIGLGSGSSSNFYGFNAKDRTLTFDFGNTYYSNVSVKVYRFENDTQFIDTTIQFILDGVEQEEIIVDDTSSQTTNEDGLFNILTPASTTTFDKIVFTFKYDRQDLREIEILTTSLSLGIPTAYKSLGVGLGVNRELPDGVFLGVNGMTYIQNPLDNSQRELNDEYRDDFLLFAELGVISEDLALGGDDIWLADYVFEEDYNLPSLQEIEDYISEHKHLPGVIGQKELDNKGYYSIDEMLIGQLKNLEELTLHIISQEKEIVKEEKELEELKVLVESLEHRIAQLEKK